MYKVFTNSNLSNLFIPIIVFFAIIIPSYFGNAHQIAFKIFYLPFTMFCVLSFLIYRRKCVFLLSMNILTIKYPFNFPNRINFEIDLNDIGFVTFIDPSDARMTLAKLEIHYKRDSSIKIFTHDVKYKKIQNLIDELRLRGVNVKVKSSSLT